MKFFCEYCGCRIDAEHDKKCPNCGASYKKNATFLKLEEEKKQQVEETKNFTGKFSKIFLIIFFSAFAIIIVVSTLIIGAAGKAGSKIRTAIIDQVEEQTTKPEKVTVGLNEYGKTSKYQAKVTGYEQTAPEWYQELKSGYEYVTFYLEVGNLTTTEISSEDVNCIVDGVAQTNTKFDGSSTLPYSIQSELTVKGEATFEVPIDAKSYDIRYGDYITIHIEK